MIDLDAPPPVRRQRRHTGPRWWKAAAAAALLLVLGGAVVPEETARPLHRVASSGGEVLTSLLTESGLYTAVAVTGEDAVEVWARPLTGDGQSWSARLRGGTVRLSSAGGAVVAESAGTVTVLGVRDGAVRWSDRAAALAVGERHLFTVSARGRLAVRDIADGRELATWTGDFGVRGAAIAGDRLFLLGDARVVALRLPELTPLWTAGATLPETARACGEQLCVTGPRGMAGYDQATGRERWRGAAWTTYRGDVVTAGGRPGGAVTDGNGRAAVIDTATGRTVGELGTDVPVGNLRLRPVGGLTWVLDLRSGQALGKLAGVVASGCSAAGRFLGCLTVDGRFTVWTVRARPAA